MEYLFLLIPIYFLFKKKGLNIRTYPTLVNEYLPLVIENNRFWLSEPSLILAIIFQESGGDNQAIGDNGNSLGLMQIQAGAWQDSGILKEYNKKNAFNPVYNIQAGTGYLNFLFNQLNDIDLTIMSYNVGIGNIKQGKYLDRGRNYLNSVLKHKKRIEKWL